MKSLRNVLGPCTIMAFFLFSSFNSVLAQESEPEVDKVFTKAQEMPRFPGCEDMEGGPEVKQKCAEGKMLHYIYRNIQYPELARINGVEGMVVISFIVEKDGAISDAKILRNLMGGCGEEALRIVNTFPKWTPGKEEGELVRVQFNLPVRFKLQGGKRKKDTVQNKAEKNPEPSPTPEEEEREPKEIVENTGTMILIQTAYGDMKVKLFDETPLHRDNFIKLAKQGFFDDLLFHRVISGFMIQGGDPNSKGAPAGQALGTGGPSYTIPAEFDDKLVHLKGRLSAARQGDQVNPRKESSGSQFYIVQGNGPADENMLKQMEERKGFKYTPEQREAYKKVGGTPFLDRDYTVFGEVVEGLDVIDKIAAVRTSRGRDRDRPIEDVKMSITVLE